MLTRVLLVVVILVGLLAVATTASPVRVHAMDGSAMAPTIGAGDAYVVVEADTVAVGDIVVFWAPETDGFETSRIVERTDAGYLTKGDGEPTTDQAAGRSPVPRSGIVGKVPTVDETPLVLPGIGGLVAVAGGQSLPLLALAALLAGVLVIRGRRGYRRPTPDRHVWRVSDVAGVLVVGLLLTSLAVTPLMASSFQVTFMATEDGGETRYAVPIGESVTRSVEVPFAQPPLTTLVVDAGGMSIERVDRTDSTLTVTATVPPSDTGGAQPAQLAVFPYPALLPHGILAGFHAMHPVVAMLASAGTLLGLLGLPYLMFVDGDRPIRTTRIRRQLRQFLRERP